MFPKILMFVAVCVSLGCGLARVPNPPVPSVPNVYLLPAAIEGQPYQTMLPTTVEHPVFRLDSGHIPAGLELRGDGLLSGIPAELCACSFVVAIYSSDSAVSVLTSYSIH